MRFGRVDEVLLIAQMGRAVRRTSLEVVAGDLLGNFQIGATGRSSGEVLELVDIVHLSPGGLAQVRQEVLKLEERAYQISDVYRDTPPME